MKTPFLIPTILACLLITGCSTSGSQPSSSGIDQDKTNSGQSIVRDRTVYDFDDQGRAFVVPGGYRHALWDSMPHSSKTASDMEPKEKAESPFKEPGAETETVAIQSKGDTPNVWDRYCNGGELTEEEHHYVMNHNLPPEYQSGCYPDK